MREDFKIKIINFCLLVAVISNWLYDFCVIHNFEEFGGYSAYSAGFIWFHERNIHEFTGGIMIDTILLVRYLTLHKLRFFILNIFLCLLLLGICFTGIIIPNYYFGANVDSSIITLLNKILVLVLFVAYFFYLKLKNRSRD